MITKTKIYKDKEYIRKILAYQKSKMARFMGNISLRFRRDKERKIFELRKEIDKNEEFLDWCDHQT